MILLSIDSRQDDRSVILYKRRMEECECEYKGLSSIQILRGHDRELILGVDRASKRR